MAGCWLRRLLAVCNHRRLARALSSSLHEVRHQHVDGSALGRQHLHVSTARASVGGGWNGRHCTTNLVTTSDDLTPSSDDARGDT